MTITVNKKTYEAGELVAYVEKLEKENAELEKACEETQELLDKQIAVTYKLVEENAELRTKTTALENANRAMVKELDDMTSGGVSVLENVVRSKEQLAKAKEIIEELYNIIPASISDYAKEPMEYARKFLTDEAAKKFRVTKKKIL